jgi:hypothetical protein
VKSKYESQNLTEKIVPETESVAFPKTCSERVVDNPHFGRILRQRLESRHGEGALRDALAQLTDAQLIAIYLKNERQGRDHLAKTQTQKQADKVNHLIRRAEKEAS